MVTVTPKAIGRLKELLTEHTSDQGLAVRIVPSPSDPKGFELVLDKEKTGDHAVKDQEEKTVLLIAADMLPKLKKISIDYSEGGDDPGFLVTGRAS